jgi:ribosomal protein S18 acetylase RimI-like enzyme
VARGPLSLSPQAALDDNFAELLAWYASRPGGELVRADDAWLCHSGVPFRAINAACRIRLGEPGRIAEVAEFFIERTMPWRWLVGPTSLPADLGRRLEAAGHVCVTDSPGMALDLDAFVAEPVVRPDLVVARVADEAGLAHWRAVQAAGLDLDPVRDEAWWTAHRRSGFAVDAPLVNWVASLDGRPVSAAALFDGAGVAGIYNVVTIPEARGRGMARAVTTAALEEGRRRGRRLAVLGSSDLGLPLYRRLGFREVSRLRSYAPAP